MNAAAANKVFFIFVFLLSADRECNVAANSQFIDTSLKRRDRGCGFAKNFAKSRMNSRKLAAARVKSPPVDRFCAGPLHTLWLPDIQTEPGRTDRQSRKPNPL